MIRIVENPSGDWRRLDERIEQVTEEIEVLARDSESCRQLMTVPGIGPLIASAMVAAIDNGAAFTKGRDFATWLGLVPKQMSTGDRATLGRYRWRIGAVNCKNAGSTEKEQLVCYFGPKWRRPRRESISTCYAVTSVGVERGSRCDGVTSDVVTM